ncbi:MlaD family protein [Nocardia asteroides]|uniref:MlaD family protein n=1 Tax=Nocardia asteroides TaxID=1824 RepID=UPI0037A98E03
MSTASGRRFAATVLAALVCLGMAGCGFDPAQVPVPGTAIDGATYRIRIEFSSVLNLPAKSKVIANGAEVGRVDSVEIVAPADAPAGRGGHVVVTAEIADSVRLPANTVAELRQNTILGDIFVALSTPRDGFATVLGDGATIPLDHTRPPVQIEDTMSAMALFVNGGAVGQLQSIVHRTNGVLPADPGETARIAATLGANAADLAAHLDQVDVLLTGLTGNADVLLAIPDELTSLLTPAAVATFTGTTDSIIKTFAIFGALGPVGDSLAWLTPLARSGDAAAMALLPLAIGSGADLRAPANLRLLTDLLRDKVFPLAAAPKVDVGTVTTSVSDADQTDRIIQALRMIGMVR